MAVEEPCTIERLVRTKAEILDALEADREPPRPVDDAEAVAALTVAARDVLHVYDDLLADEDLWTGLQQQAERVSLLRAEDVADLYHYAHTVLPVELQALPWSVPPTLREFVDGTVDALDTAMCEPHDADTQRQRISDARRQFGSFTYRLRGVVRGVAGPDDPRYRRRVLRNLLRTAARTLPVFIVPGGPGSLLTLTAGLELITRWLRDEQAAAPSSNIRHELGALSNRLNQIRHYALTARDALAAGTGTRELIESSSADIRAAVFDAERGLRMVTDALVKAGRLEGPLERDLDVLAAGLREVRRRAGLARRADHDPGFEAQAVDSEVSEALEALHHATLLLQDRPTDLHPRAAVAELATARRAAGE